jgi:tRNA threonylcarbamoyl adenosine modification protein (Sua5/YciO/YrdC/YwlC family)
VSASVIDVERAIEMLKTGGVVAVPTDTVYGLAASIASDEAVARLFELKRRPSSTALPILVDSINQIHRLGVEWTASAERLSDAFWPGALTIVVHVPRALAARVGSTSETAGFRLADDDVLRSIMEHTGPLAVSSANDHGQAPCQSAGEVLERLGARPQLLGVVDDGDRSGVVSTVVDVSLSPWQLVRAGAVTAGVIKGILG